MRLTLYTDYSLRVLIYLALEKDQQVTISELADFYKISRNHLVKVVHNLGLGGYIQTTRGKHGGIRLARSPEHIIIGEVVRETEPDLDLLECFNPAEDKCTITHTCGLKAVLLDARNTFIGTLDQYTLADIIKATAKPVTAFKSISIVHG